MTGPLSGVRVIDLTSVVSGPFATMFLADQGADVIKVEPPGGDITRRSRQSVDPTGQFSALFISTNRGKRSLVGRPQAARGHRDPAQADRPLRRAGAELPAAGHGPAGPRRGGHARAQSAPDLRLDQRRRRQRPVRREAHLRSRSSRACRASPTCRPRPETAAAADDPDHRGRQDHLGRHRPGGGVGPVRAREDRRGPAHQGGDARRHDLLSLAGSHDAVHGGRPGGCGERPQGAARPDLPDARRLHDGGHHLGLRMAGLLPRRRAAGARRGQALQHAGRAHRQRQPSAST